MEKGDKNQEETEVATDGACVYELGYHINPAFADEALVAAVKNLHGIIAKDGGTVIAEEFPKAKQLAYAIVNKIGGKNVTFDRSYFGWIKFEIEGSFIPAFQEILKNDKDIIRFLLISTVRENTMTGNKIAGVQKEGEAPIAAATSTKKKADDDAPKAEISEAELDKKIAELVIE